MYLIKSDLQLSIEQALLEALDFSQDASVITTACNQAVGQLRSYLSTKYDIDTELGKTAANRNEMLLMIAKDLAIYHIWTYVDPTSIPGARRDRYTAAIDYLKGAQLGTVVINITAAVTTYSPITGGSNNKRSNHY